MYMDVYLKWSDRSVENDKMSSAETYDKILQTAYRLFLQKGYTATSMRQVAEEAGIGKATIYHHFPDKEAIAMALLEKTGAHMEESLQLVRAESDPRERIRVAVTTNFKFLLEFAEIMQVVRREVGGGRDQMQAGFVKFFGESIVLLTDAVRRGTEKGIFRSVDPARAARTLMTMITGSFALSYLGGERPQFSEESAAALLDVYFQGIEVR
jgi:AcrR family transcriptional regulator